MSAKPPDQVTSEAMKQGQMVLDDIHRRTGLRFRLLGGIDRNQVDVMTKILPIAKEWINSGPGEIRGALYFLFLTPAALPYVDDVLSWAQNEQSPVDREVLTQVMRLVVTRKTAARIWETYKRLKPTNSEALLLPKLARVPQVCDEVVHRIMEFLAGVAERVDRGERVRTFALGPVQEYSRVRDPRVRAWFSRYMDSPDPDLRAVARRSGGIKPVLPKGWRTTAGMPDGSRVVLSTEIDSHAFPEFLKELKRDLGLDFTSDFEPEHVAANLRERKWVLYDVARSRAGPVDLWLRLEDSSTIEIWVVKSAVNRVT